MIACLMPRPLVVVVVLLSVVCLHFIVIVVVDGINKLSLSRFTLAELFNILVGDLLAGPWPGLFVY